MSRPTSRIRQLTSVLAWIALILGYQAQHLEGQELPWIQGGKVRLDFFPTYWTWDSRYGIGPSGADEIEELGMDLWGDPLGREILPDLGSLEESLQQALQDPSYRVRLGVSQAYRDQSRLVFPFRLDIGITDWLTIGGMAPLVRSRSEITFALDADSLTATDGISPFEADPAAVITFLDAFRNALLTAQATHPADPAVLEAQEYLDVLTKAYSHSSFFPADGSQPGAKLQERLEEFRTAFSSLGVFGLPLAVPLADSYMDEESFQGFLGGRHMRAAPLEDWTDPFVLGDIEITADVRLLHRGFEPDSAGQLPRLRLQAGGGVLVRLGTGANADPARFFDQDHGDGQMDFEANAFGMMEFGSRLGAWGQVRYGIQTEGDVFRRIAAPSETLPAFSRTVPLKWTPGDYFELDLNPRVFLTPDMSFGVRYHLWSKGEDSYSLGAINTEIQDPAELPPADLLNLETEQTLQEIGFSATYSSVGPHARGEVGMPLLIRATYFQPVGGSGGRTPKGGRFQVGITIFKTFWGGERSAGESQELSGVVP